MRTRSRCANQREMDPRIPHRSQPLMFDVVQRNVVTADPQSVVFPNVIPTHRRRVIADRIRRIDPQNAIDRQRVVGVDPVRFGRRTGLFERVRIVDRRQPTQISPQLGPIGIAAVPSVIIDPARVIDIPTQQLAPLAMVELGQQPTLRRCPIAGG